MATEKYIASSVFVNAPTGTDLNFGNGVSFNALVNEVSQTNNVLVGAFVGDYYLTGQKSVVTVNTASSGVMYLPENPEPWSDFTVNNFSTESIVVGSSSGDFNYLGTIIGITINIPANVSLRFVRNDAGEWAAIPQADLTVRNLVVTLSSADVLTLGSIPVVLLNAKAGVAYEPLSLTWKTNFNTTAYDVTSVTSIDLTVGGTSYFSDTALLPLTASTTKSFSFARFTGDAIALSTNTAISLSCVGGDPTLGNSTVTIELLYKINTFA